MKRYIVSLLFVSITFAQSTQTLTAPPPQSVGSVSTTLVGSPGPRTLYYWVIANWPRGKSIATSTVIRNAPNTLTATNYVRVTWTPIAGATNYDVLRTTTSTLPGTCTGCLLALGSTTGTFNDTGPVGPPYVYNPVGTATATLSLDNSGYIIPRLLFNMGINNTLFSGLPSVTSARGNSYLVTDALASNNCGAGGGLGGTPALCYSNGTTWIALSGSSSLTYPPTGVVTSTGVAWGNPATASTIVGLFGSGSCSGYLKSTGDCDAGTGGATGLTVAASDPVGNCTFPVTGGVLPRWVNTITQEEWWCSATNTWKKSLSTTNIGPVQAFGASGTAPTRPTGSDVGCYFDGGGKSWVCLDSGTATAVMPAKKACNAGEHISAVDAGVSTCTADTGASGTPATSMTEIEDFISGVSAGTSGQVGKWGWSVTCATAGIGGNLAVGLVSGGGSTSVTSITPATPPYTTGNIVLVEGGMMLFPGVGITITSRGAPTNFIAGTIATYNGGSTITVNVTSSGGSATRTDWDIEIADTVSHPGVFYCPTTTTAGNIAVMTPHTNNTTGAAVIPYHSTFDVAFVLRYPDLDSSAITRFGLGVNATSPPTNGIYLEKLGADTNWFIVVRSASANVTRVDTGITATQGWIAGRICRSDSTTIKYFLGSTLGGFADSCSAGTSITGTAPIYPLTPFAEVETSTTATRGLLLDLVQIKITGMSR